MLNGFNAEMCLGLTVTLITAPHIDIFYLSISFFALIFLMTSKLVLFCAAKYLLFFEIPNSQ